MARRSVESADQTVMLAEDDVARSEHRWWALLRLRVVDEITGKPPVAPVRISSTTAGFVPQVGQDGVCGLAGRPRDVSSVLVTPGAISAEVMVPGYLPRSLDADIDRVRRRLPLGAGLNARTLTMLPLESSPRTQFVPGRGVVVQRRISTEPEQMTLVDDPLAAPALNEIPVREGIVPARNPGANLAGVPLDLGDQPMHRAEQATLRGACTRNGVLNNAVARIGFAGVWWTQDEVARNSNPTHPANLASCACPLAFNHVSGATGVLCALAPADAVQHLLRVSAASGQTQLLLSPWATLNPNGGDVLELEAANSTERELVVTAGYDNPGPPSAAATLRLRTPLAFPHAAGTVMGRRQVVPGAPFTIEREALRGDRTLFLSVSLAIDPVLRLEPGTPRDELHFARRLPAFGLGQVDATGHFEFAPLGRVAQVRLRAQYDAEPELPPIDVAPDYGGDNFIPIRFTP